MRSPLWGSHSNRRQRLAAVVVVALASTSALVTPLEGSSAVTSASFGTVVRVIDGDTLVISVNGQSEDVRVLNIDTPETKDPRRPVECLGPEAAAFTKRLAKPGTEVALEFDEEERDRWGRLLATVILPSGDSLSERIASAGLGVPIVVGGNDKFAQGVRDAFEMAQRRQVGFFNKRNDCTVPAQLAAIEQQLTAAASPGLLTQAAAAHSAAKRLAYALALAYVFDVRLHSASTALKWVAAASSKALKRRAKALMRLGRRELAAMSRLDARLGTAERRYRAQLARAERDAEYERQYGSEDDGNSGSSGVPNGYTGPRCYEPGGIVWHPC